MVVKVSLSEKIFKIFNVFVMSCILFLMLYPFWNMLVMSFSREGNIIAGQVHFWPVGWNVAAYRMVFEHPHFLRSYWNTIYYTVVATVMHVFMTVITAYPLSKNMPGRSFFMKFLTVTMFFGGGMIPNFLLVRNLGMLDTIWAITVPGIVNAWGAIIMMTFFKGIPDSLEEAAHIDGMGPFGTLWKIVLPLSKPIIATTVLFGAVGMWNNWFGPFIYLRTNERMPVTLFLRGLLMSAQGMAGQAEWERAMDGPPPGEALKAAAIILVTAPILCVYPFVQKHFVKGVLVGSIK